MTNMPNFIIITGFAGSGKTTFAKALAKKVNAVYINKDTVADIFVNYILVSKGLDECSRESYFYNKYIKELEYKASFDICFENLDLGQNVILDIPFIVQLQNYNAFSPLISKFQNAYNTKIVFMKHILDNEKSRIFERKAKRDTNKIKCWEAYSNSIKDFKIDEKYNVIEVNSYDNSLENIVDNFVKNYL